MALHHLVNRFLHAPWQAQSTESGAPAFAGQFWLRLPVRVRRRSLLSREAVFLFYLTLVSARDDFVDSGKIVLSSESFDFEFAVVFLVGFSVSEGHHA